MNEFFAVQVDGHIEDLEKVLAELRRLDTFPLDIVDRSRLSHATRTLQTEIETFRRFAESARMYPAIA